MPPTHAINLILSRGQKSRVPRAPSVTNKHHHPSRGLDRRERGVIAKSHMVQPIVPLRWFWFTSGLNPLVSFPVNANNEVHGSPAFGLVQKQYVLSFARTTVLMGKTAALMTRMKCASWPEMSAGMAPRQSVILRGKRVRTPARSKRHVWNSWRAKLQATSKLSAPSPSAPCWSLRRYGSGADELAR